MYVRMNFLKIRPGMAHQIEGEFDKNILPLFRSAKGFKEYIRLVPVDSPDERVVLLFWENKEDLDAFLQGKEYLGALAKFNNAFVQSPTGRIYEICKESGDFKL